MSVSNRVLLNLNDAAPKIAAAPGLNWTVQPEIDSNRSDGMAHLDGPDGLKLWLSTTWGPAGMLHVSGSWPRGTNGQSYQPYKSNGDRQKYSINVGLAKTPEQMAREIERRLLPAYRTALAEAWERKRRDDDADAELARIAAELAALVNKPAPNKGSEGYSVYAAGISFRVTHGPTVEFQHLYLEPEMARRILPILCGTEGA